MNIRDEFHFSDIHGSMNTNVCLAKLTCHNNDSHVLAELGPLGQSDASSGW